MSNKSSTKPRVSHKTKCFQCTQMSGYYKKALNSSRKNLLFQCDNDLFQLVELSIQLLQYHADHDCPWKSALLYELCELSKQIKEESMEVDRLVIPSNEEPEEEQEEGWDRAIRISIYYCRASFYEQHNIQRALEYYKKCLCVRPSNITSLVQRSARIALEQLRKTHIRPYLTSRTSSVSSIGLAVHTPCSNCGREKRGMPVCSHCKSQYYCSVKCLKEHKPIHVLDCGSLK